MLKPPKIIQPNMLDAKRLINKITAYQLLGRDQLLKQEVERLPGLTADELLRHEQDRNPRERFMAAKYVSTCLCCGKRIDPGQDIYWAPVAPVGTNRHVTCAKTPDYTKCINWGMVVEYNFYLEQAEAILFQYPGFHKDWAPRLISALKSNLTPAQPTDTIN